MGIPNEPGLYLAKNLSSYKWWNIIALVEGEVPFLTIKIWNISHNILHSNVHPKNLTWGPKIISNFELTKEECVT
jgi:hypothetical protein